MSAAPATDDNPVPPPPIGQDLKYAGFTRFELELEVCVNFITSRALLRQKRHHSDTLFYSYSLSNAWQTPGT